MRLRRRAHKARAGRAGAANRNVSAFTKAEASRRRSRAAPELPLRLGRGCKQQPALPSNDRSGAPKVLTQISWLWGRPAGR